MAEPIQQLRDLLAHARWNAAIELLRRHSPEEASRAVMALPFDQQRLLFRRLPIDSAATLIGQFPYFHAYAVLYSLSAPQIAAIIGAMEPGEAAGRGGRTGLCSPACGVLAHHRGAANRKVFSAAGRQRNSSRRADGLLDRAEYNSRPSRSFRLGQIHDTANAFWTSAAFPRRNPLAWTAATGLASECGYRLPEFRFISVAECPRKCRSAPSCARHGTC
jgi:hypothetical protein